MYIENVILLKRIYWRYTKQPQGHARRQGQARLCFKKNRKTPRDAVHDLGKIVLYDIK
jgi:hypothetical protein